MPRIRLNPIKKPAIDVGPSKPPFAKKKPWWLMRGEEREKERLQPPRGITGVRG
jgi:hypothetical protein